MPKRRSNLISLSISLIIVFFVSLCEAKLNQTYPTSATTFLRMETYQDGFETVYQSSWNINVSTWEIIGSSYTYISSTEPITGFIATISSFTYNVDGTTTTNWNIQDTSWPMTDFINLIRDETRLRDTNKILDDDIEEYLVWPDTSPPAGWQGWCLKQINENPVPVTCQ